MKKLILASAALSALLAACGGSDENGDHGPDATPLDSMLAPTRLAAMIATVPTALPAFAAQRPTDGDDPGGTPGGDALPAGQLLELLIKDGQAQVCTYKRGVRPNVCAVIEAPLPPATNVEYWRLDDGEVVTYTAVPGVADLTDTDADCDFRPHSTGPRALC